MTLVLNEHRAPTHFHEVLMESTPDGRIRFGGEAQLANVKNANGRIYPEKLWNMVMDDQRFRDRLESRKILGELDHPGDGRSKLTNAAMVVTEMKLAPSKRYPGKTAVYMQYETLSTPAGKILECLHRDKVGLAVSSRGDGEVRRVRDVEFGEAQEVIPETFKFETFDVVIDPSVDVDIRRIGESQTVAAAVHKILESEGSKLKESDIHYYRELLSDLAGSKSISESTVVDLKTIASQIMSNPHASPTPEDIMPNDNSAAVDIAAANRALQTKVDGYEAQIKAAEEITKQLRVDVLNSNMRAKHFEQLYTQTRSQVDESDSIIAAFLEGDEDGVAEAPEYQELVAANEELQKSYDAAESLVESLTDRLEAAAREQHILKITEGLSQKQVEAVTPFLTKCESIEEMDATFKDLRGLISESTSRPAVTAKLTPRNPIETIKPTLGENKKPVNMQSDPRMAESLKLTEAMKARNKATLHG
jgi:Prohead core protein serine protease